MDLTEQHAAPRAGLTSDIVAALREFLGGRRLQLEQISTELAPAFDELERFILDGGKRLRPTFAYWGWRGAGGPDAQRPEAVTAAASLELLQACALIHDDVMDASATRRGKPAVHRHFAVSHRANSGRGDADAHGEAVAVLLGDFALAWTDDMLRTSGFSAEQLEQAWPVFERMRTELLAGQYLDLASQAYGAPDVDRARRVAVYKSAKYTVEAPLLLGGALGGASPQLTATYSGYGLPLGEAFQLRDDVLGVFGDPALTGKPAGDDLREGKRTVLVATAVQRADHTESAVLERGLGNTEIDTGEIDRMRQIIVDTGALATTETLIEQLHDRALSALADVARADIVTGEAAHALTELAGAATVRTR